VGERERERKKCDDKKILLYERKISTMMIYFNMEKMSHSFLEIGTHDTPSVEL